MRDNGPDSRLVSTLLFGRSKVPDAKKPISRTPKHTYMLLLRYTIETGWLAQEERFLRSTARRSALYEYAPFLFAAVLAASALWSAPGTGLTDVSKRIARFSLKPGFGRLNISA